MAAATVKDKRVVILGASGRIGFDLCTRLAAENEVIGVARFSDPERRKALDDLGVSTITLDFSHDKLDAVPADVDLLFIEVAYQHGAEDHPEMAEIINVHLPARAMLHFRRAKGVVFASTGNVYGLPGRTISEASKEAPIGVYGLSRYAGEKVVAFFSREFGIPAAILRYFYGNDRRYGIIKKIAETLLQGEQPPVWMGYEINCIAHEELVQRTLGVTGHLQVPPLVMNVTSSKPYNLIQVIDLIAKELDIEPLPLEHVEERMRMTLAAVTPVQDKLLGPTKIPLKDIVADVCQALKLQG